MSLRIYLAEIRVTIMKKAKTKKTVLRVIAAILCIAWMVLIFVFSSKDATDSAKQSEGVTAFVVNVILDLFTDITEEEKDAARVELEPKIRTLAHFTLFFVLASLYYYFLSAFGNRIEKNALLAFCSAAVYAVTDEIHQYFVPGRTMQLSDLVTDSMGAALAVALIMLVLFAIKVKNSENNTPQ